MPRPFSEPSAAGRDSAAAPVAAETPNDVFAARACGACSRQAPMIRVVLPAHNEFAALPTVLGELAAVSRARFDGAVEVVVVDDGSTDDTGSVAVSQPGLVVRLIAHETNRGLGAALARGLGAALEETGRDDAIVVMDADNTHPPWLLPRLVDQLSEGRDVVIASRYQAGARIIGAPAHRRALSRGMSLLFRVIYPIPGARDYSSGFRAYRSGLLHRAFAHYGEGFVSEAGFTSMVDVLIKLSRLGAIVGEVPLVLRYDRKQGPSQLAVAPTARRTLRLLLRRRLGRLD